MRFSGFQIAVNDPVIVRLGERRTGLREEARRAPELHRPLALEHGREIVALDVLHDEIERVLELAEVERVDDVRMVELAYGLRLEPKAVNHLVLRGHLWREDLHGGDLAEAQVLDAIHDAHSAAADALEHAVAPVDDAVQPAVIRRARRAGRDRGAAAAAELRALGDVRRAL